jgi:hypothetical protein
LVSERRRCARPDPRVLVGRDDRLRSFRRTRRLLDGLEAGLPVVVVRWLLGSRRSVPPVDLPWDRGSVVSVRVSPDDVVSPVEYDCGWPGSVAGDAR